MLVRATGEAVTAEQRGLRVLLVEDDDGNQEVETLMLQRLGFEVDVVANGAEAVTAAAAAEYAAILMDCQLPVLDGYQATAAIRGDEAPGAHVSIIGLSVHTDRQRCFDAGMDDHLAKPFALDALAQVLGRTASEAGAGATATDGESVLDPAIIEQLRALAQAGNADLLHKLQASFARDTPERLRALRAAVIAGDAEAVAFNIHTLKGSAANLGAREIVVTCQRIEHSPGVPDLQVLEPLLSELEQSAVRAQAELLRVAVAG
jgi:two-component system, sensor histidine kinase and response regulator